MCCGEECCLQNFHWPSLVASSLLLLQTSMDCRAPPQHDQVLVFFSEPLPFCLHTLN